MTFIMHKYVKYLIAYCRVPTALERGTKGEDGVLLHEMPPYMKCHPT